MYLMSQKSFGRLAGKPRVVGHEISRVARNLSKGLARHKVSMLGVGLSWAKNKWGKKAREGGTIYTNALQKINV